MYEYPVSVVWQGGVDGEGIVRAERIIEPMPLAVPPEYKGLGGGTNPEELMTASVASCYSITLGILAANKKLPVSRIETDATGHVEQEGLRFTYTKVVINCRVVMAGDAEDEELDAVKELFPKAETYCIITNAISGKVAVSLETEVTRA